MNGMKDAQKPKSKKEFYTHLKDWADDSLPGWLGRVGVPRPGTVRLSFTTVPGLVLVFVVPKSGCCPDSLSLELV